MKKLVILFFVITISLLYCKNVSDKESNKIDSEKMTTKENSSKKAVLKNFEKAHSLSTEDGKLLGDVYIRPISSGSNIFESLLIIKNKESQIDTLYEIKNCKFINPAGIDIKVYCDNHYGYKFIKKADTYLVIVSLNNKGKNVSSHITIEWNKSKGIFEVFKT